MSDPLSVTAMLLIGLLGAGHCLGMCGGLSAAMGMAVDSHRKLPVLLGYNIGRVISYSIAGFLVGLLSYWGAHYLAAGPALRTVAGVLLVLMGLYIAQWWKILTWLERFGQLLWRYIQPFANNFLPVKNPGKAVVAGMLWGWLPCGLVYSALAYAATAAEPAKAAIMMLAFGIGTAPAVLLSGVFAQSLRSFLQRNGLKQLMGFCLIIFGVWTLVVSLQHSHTHHGAGSHGNQHSEHQHDHSH